MLDHQHLTARQVMDLFHISKNTLYSGPLRQLAVAVGKRRGLRWQLKRLIDWELETTHVPAPNNRSRAESSGE